MKHRGIIIGVNPLILISLNLILLNSVIFGLHGSMNTNQNEGLPVTRKREHKTTSKNMQVNHPVDQRTKSASYSTALIWAPLTTLIRP